jgi:hypothetical protein
VSPNAFYDLSTSETGEVRDLSNRRSRSSHPINHSASIFSFKTEPTQSFMIIDNFS